MRTSHRPKRSIDPATTLRPSFPWWTTVLLLLVGFGVRGSFVLHGHPAFNSDESTYFEWITSYPDFSGWDSWHATQRGALRIWLHHLLYQLTEWRLSGPFTAILLNLAGCALWSLWIARRISPIAGWGAALYFAAAPSCIAYYGTLLDTRQECMIYAAILFLGAGSWFHDPIRTAGVGFLAAWGTWSEPFFVFFLAPWVWWELRQIKTIPIQRWVLSIPFFLSGMLLGAMPWVLQMTEPVYRDFMYLGESAHYRFRFADPRIMTGNVMLLLRGTLEYWTGNIPYGYFQDTPLARHLNPPLSGFIRTSVLILYALVSGAALFGWWGSARHKRGALLIPVFLVPMALFLVFFVVGPKVVNAWGFRFLAFGIFVMAAGIGLLFDQMARRGKGPILSVIVLILVAHGSSWILHQTGKSGIHPARYLAERFQEAGLRYGTADYWVSEVVRYESGGAVELTPHSSSPFRLDVEARVYGSDRIGVLFVDGRDSATRRKQLMGILSNTHRPVRVIDQGENWTILEMRRKRSIPP